MANPYTPKEDTLPIPVYQIDLSLPPELRYATLAKDFGPKMQTLTHLFDEIVASISPNKFVRKFVTYLASLVLFRVYGAEETKELRGIAKASGVKMFLLVALNVILDSLLGCTSGGVVVAPKETEADVDSQIDENEARMMHFRTLDWGMDPLRDVLVVLEFVRSDSEEPEKVLARTVTYTGFVGVLTGVRKDLSLSLNFRPYHECSNRSLRIHQLLVLLGLRPSVSSILRKYIVPSASTPIPTPALDSITKELETTRTSPCYLILSSGDETAVMEKDLSNARTATSKEFIVATNCDCQAPAPSTAAEGSTSNAVGMEMIIDEADERKDLVEKRFKDAKKRQEKKWKDQNAGSLDGFKVKVKENTVMGWLQVYPVWNELTHFGCLMDPKRGEVRWIGRGLLSEDGDKEGANGTMNGVKGESAGGWRNI